jgi:hypothetical protein
MERPNQLSFYERKVNKKIKRVPLHGTAKKKEVKLEKRETGN